MANFKKTILYFIFISSNSLTSNEVPYFMIDDVKINGIYSNDGLVESYLGVPYASPPVNELRWQEPQDKIYEAKSYNAFNYPAACMQGPRISNWYKEVAKGFGGNPDYIKFPAISEDCLYLNIWKPNNIKIKNLPVLVFIHGGSNRAGWSFEPNYEGKKLAQNGAIVITIAYRLGIFGFYSNPELDKSNFALLDIIQSLKWIKNNISLLGGDPNNITISGESSGATNIEHLIVSPLSKNLFNKAIHQSGGWTIAENTIDYELPKILSNKLSQELLGHGNDRKSINKLRQIDAKDILEISENIYGSTGYYSVVDNYSIIEPIKESFKKGNFHNVDMIIGSNANEEFMYLGDHFSLSDFYKERLNLGFYDSIESIEEMLPETYNEKAKLDMLLSSRNYACPSFFIADSIVRKNKNKVWVYSFDRVRDGQKSKEMGAYHGAELPYIFNTHDEWLPTSAVDIEITKIIQDHWIEFIKNGNPNTKLFNVWPEHKLYKNNVISYNNKVISKTHDSSKICKKLIY